MNSEKFAPIDSIMSEMMNVTSQPTKSIWDILKIGQQMNGGGCGNPEEPYEPLNVRNSTSTGYPKSIFTGGAISVKKVSNSSDDILRDLFSIDTETSEYHDFDDIGLSETSVGK